MYIIKWYSDSGTYMGEWKTNNYDMVYDYRGIEFMTGLLGRTSWKRLIGGIFKIDQINKEEEDG